MIVYVVWWDNDMCGIFSTYEKAENHIKENRVSGDWSIEKYEVDS